MDKRERVLSMGYLVKSPSKNKEKANFQKFWKLRWCVFVEIVYKLSHENDCSEEQKLVLYYYKDRESHQRHENPKGQLHISSCKSIKSCYQSQAGFHHLFKVECSDGKVVKFSCASCQTKVRWLECIHNHRFNASLPVGTTEQAQQNSSRNTRSRNHRMSACYEDFRTFQHKANNQRMTRTSSMNCATDVLYAKVQKEPKGELRRFSNGSIQGDEPPPPPPPRDTNAEPLVTMPEHRLSFRRKNSEEAELDLLNKLSSPHEDKKLCILQKYNDLYMLCEKCQSENGASKAGKKARRRSSSKKMRNIMHENLMEVANETVDEHCGRMWREDDVMSRGTVSSEDSGGSVGAESAYSEINDEEWIRQVKEKTAQLEELEGEGRVGEEVKKDEDYDEDDEDEFIYEDMRQYSKEDDLSPVAVENGTAGFISTETKTCEDEGKQKPVMKIADVITINQSQREKEREQQCDKSPETEAGSKDLNGNEARRSDHPRHHLNNKKFGQLVFQYEI